MGIEVLGKLTIRIQIAIRKRSEVR